MRGGPACIAVSLLLGVAGCDAGERGVDRADASAGSWRTWVLRAPDQIRVPEPPGGSEAPDPAEDRMAPAVQPWLDQAMELVSRRPKDPVTASRNYALVAVAMYDAAVAARHWQARYDRPDHPATEAAIAGAGSRVVAYAYPEHPAARLDADAEQAVNEMVAGRRASKPGALAGLALGRAVADEVIARAREDGSDRPWRGRRPRFRGVWKPPPGSAARPVAPGAGRWKTWVMPSGRALRPPAPPRYGSRRFLAEVRAVLRTDAALTGEQKRIAEFWAGGDGTELPPGRWLKVTLEYLRHRPAVSEVRTARIFALLSVAMADAGIAAWDAKYAYWVTRPENAVRDLGLDPDWKPYLDTPFFPAYVSGHATYSGAAGEILAHLFPEDAGVWRRRAQEAADSRVYGGIHYPMDGEDGLRMGEAIGRLVVERARRDGAEA